MRADRLLSLLMLLQARDRMTAKHLAKELEVSERTVYRDIEALSAAGVPVYGEPGREGGFALLDGYKTSLTGLTKQEVRALFMLSIPAPLEELGISHELRQALLKLSAALPEPRRSVEEQVRRRFHLDSTWWEQGDEPVPYLQILYQAVLQDRKLYLKYRPLFNIELELLVDPYGLVAKAGVWYLVFARNSQVRIQRVSELIDARISTEVFSRPPGFDLPAFWRQWCARRTQRRTGYLVTVRVAPGFIPFLPMYMGTSVRAKIDQAGPPDTEGWITLELSFESLETARDRLLDYGGGVEVLEPQALRKSILDYARQIVALYG
jgi:predicted DNA-binding transcriptional regulator YafY